ncbi:hypothetical protein Tco_0282839 [Tanacetum coccineum]
MIAINDLVEVLDFEANWGCNCFFKNVMRHYMEIDGVKNCPEPENRLCPSPKRNKPGDQNISQLKNHRNPKFCTAYDHSKANSFQNFHTKLMRSFDFPVYA